MKGAFPLWQVVGAYFVDLPGSPRAHGPASLGGGARDDGAGAEVDVQAGAAAGVAQPSSKASTGLLKQRRLGFFHTAQQAAIAQARFLGLPGAAALAEQLLPDAEDDPALGALVGSSDASAVLAQLSCAASSCGFSNVRRSRSDGPAAYYARLPEEVRPVCTASTPVRRSGWGAGAGSGLGGMEGWRDRDPPGARGLGGMEKGEGEGEGKGRSGLDTWSECISFHRRYGCRPGGSARSRHRRRRPRPSPNASPTHLPLRPAPRRVAGVRRREKQLRCFGGRSMERNSRGGKPGVTAKRPAAKRQI